jgi:hypothetical protein
MELLTREYGPNAKGSKLTIQEMDDNLLFLESLGLTGTNYIYVAANGTDTENATSLQAAYNEAKTLSPTSTNRITIIAAPGYYNFGSTTFTMDTQYIDLVSLDGNRSIIFNATLNESNSTEGSIEITANDVFVKGVDIINKRFLIADNLNLLKLENCKALGEFSFGGDFSTIITNLSGTFINCEGGDFSFKSQNLSGTFINLKTGSGALGYNDTFSIASGFFQNLDCGSFSLSNNNSGTFINVRGGAFNSSIFSGLFYNCIFDSPNPVTIVGGKLYYCVSKVINLPTVSAGGRTYYCINGDGTTNNQ